MTLLHECPDCGTKTAGRFEGKPVECSNCGRELPCPVCSDDEDAPGWFTTDDGNHLACHACNGEEYKRQKQRDARNGRRRKRDPRIEEEIEAKLRGLTKLEG